MWAYHLGLGASRNFLDKQSIGIELCNEGSMTKEDDGNFYWYSGEQAIKYNRPNDKPLHEKNGWRGYEWFAPYSKEQIEASEWLVKYLCNKYGIKMDMIADCEYHPEILGGGFEGIYNHANVRDYPSSRPKWDLSPAFPFKDFSKKLIK
jgi:N-acetyl-anhydromuramyl-L-alanine amidase AmpD